MHNVVRTRTGDQLHLAYILPALTRYDGSTLEARMCSRTSCGCRVALVINRDVTVRPGLLCEKCFSPSLRAPGAALNVKLV